MSKDTLARRIPHILSGCCSRVHLLSAGKLAHQLGLEILPPLILLATVDEHFVLQGIRSYFLGWLLLRHRLHFDGNHMETQQRPGFGMGVSVFSVLISSKAKHLESSTDPPKTLDSKFIIQKQ